MKKYSILLLLILAASIFPLAAMQNSMELRGPPPDEFLTVSEAELEKIIQEEVSHAVDEAVKQVVAEKEGQIAKVEAKAESWQAEYEKEVRKRKGASFIDKLVAFAEGLIIGGAAVVILGGT